MIITKMSLPRRTVLRGLGAAVALPLLDAMVPAVTAVSKTAARPTRRFGVVYVPNGMAMEHWTPATEGPGFDFTPVLHPLERFRDQVTVVSGLSGYWTPAHAGASTTFLTGAAGVAGRALSECCRKLTSGSASIPRPGVPGINKKRKEH